MATSTPAPRRRNKRGEGARLQDDIVRAATTLLEETGHDDAVTLRAVARTAGITAPSIYAHFADRKEIIYAVATQAFDELTFALRPAADGESEPVARLFAVCRAYLDFAAERPHLYRVLFERYRTSDEGAKVQVEVATMVGADAFGVLRDAVAGCVDAGLSTETSAQAATVRAWVSLHGLATLRASLPWFPWPPCEDVLNEMITRVVDLR